MPKYHVWVNDEHQVMNFDNKKQLISYITRLEREGYDVGFKSEKEYSKKTFEEYLNNNTKPNRPDADKLANILRSNIRIKTINMWDKVGTLLRRHSPAEFEKMYKEWLYGGHQ